jgi:DNA-directed RNA polymerase subunit M
MHKKGCGLMDFCFQCGSLLMPKKVKSASQTMLAFACNKCGHKIITPSENLKITCKAIEHNPKQLVSVIGKEIQLSTLPTIQVTCLRCGNNNAYAWQVQTRGADESSTQFLRCTKCGYTYRENT